ncbi:MAG: glycine--tRNA ligase subunit beta [Actinobacteria bacterium]|nr:glycine--tRNA ligase subunit beta [Actinomycetota bacterium]
MSNLFVFEIGTEEIPAAPLVAATEQLARLAEESLEHARIGHGEIKTMSTPRRLILTIKDLAEESSPLMTRSKGPSVDIAFDADGNPTKAAIGFARGKGLEVKDLQRGKEGDKEYIYAIVEKRARRTRSMLPDILNELIVSLSWPKSQRWGSGDARFVRPVRWILALWENEIVPVTFAGLNAGRITRGHRLLANEEFEVASAASFFDILAAAWVVPSAEVRSAKIRKQIAAFEEKTGLRARTPEKIFSEVVNLVEHPNVLLGHFDEEFLRIPSEIITDAMLSHQRYFPMYDTQGALSNAFLLVSNGAISRGDIIADGNERVVRARLSDAAFFYHEDKKRPLEAYVEDLERVVFQEKLGTVGAKTRRIEALVSELCERGACGFEDTGNALRAAHLCKADLVTNAVVEFTSLQGVMGGYYAKESGETEDVVLAISEHYFPRFSQDILPSNFAGKIVAFSDKLDTICGIFSIGQGPTGSSDPFALRRGAIGIINILLAGLTVSLRDAIELAVDNYRGTTDFDRNAIIEAVRAFFATRIEVIARERGFEADTVAAVLACDIIEPTVVIARCEALANARMNSPELFEDLATAYTRAANLTDASLGTDLVHDLLTPEDNALLLAVSACEQSIGKSLESHDYPAAVQSLAELRLPIDTFFHDVLIMDKDTAVRENRLRLLNRFVEVFGSVADIGKLGK